MATPKQIDANRRNATRSTGPRTAAGKAASSRNALQTGIFARSHVIFDEHHEDLDDLAYEYFQRFQPVTPEERSLVDTLVHAEWSLRRLRRIEPDLWEKVYHALDRHGITEAEMARHPLSIYEEFSKDLDRLQTRLNSFDRIYHRALNALADLQRERQAAEAPAPNPESRTPQSKNGFVPKNRPKPAVTPFPNPESPTPPPQIGSFPAVSTVEKVNKC
jgi:hypothetical protein